MRLIVGLGNPGPRYHRTRHNVGFDVVRQLAASYGGGPPKSKFHGEIVEADIQGVSARLLLPLTFMNRSGISVREARDFFKLPQEELLVVCDDFHLPLAQLRFRTRGSSGGQKGMENIIQQLGTDQFARLRIGIGVPPPKWDVSDYVLSKFTKDEIEVISQAVQRASDAIRDWSLHGIAYCMNQYNAS